MSKIVIKSFSNGINLFLEEDCSFSEIISDLAEKFSQSKAFFGKAKVALSITGRELTSEEERKVIQTISDNSELTILCIVNKNEANNSIYLTALDMLSKQLDCDSDTIYLNDSLIDKESIETDKNVIIMGDINPGCRVESGGNVIVFGGIYGEVRAKANGYVAALDMSPEKIYIGSFHLPMKKPGKWSARPKYAPKVIYMANGECVCENLTRELFRKLK